MADLGFKYLPVDSEERLKFLEHLLIQGHLYFPSVTAFNDPNEFRFHFRPPKEKRTIRTQYFIDNPNASKQEFETWYRTTSWSSCHVYYEPLIQHDLISQLGVFCLSRTCRDPIMWAHYAANHAGICLVFNIKQLLDEIGVPISGPVSYKKKLPVVRYFGEDRVSMITKLVFTKYEGWSYEKEFRIVIPQGNITKHISPNVLLGVILGQNIPDDKEAQIRKIIADRTQPINLLRAHLSYDTYEMEVSHNPSGYGKSYYD